ncbi:Serine/threonine-protein kinase PknH [Planctomycetes bacterium CA13]|uniref:Serine/threonine-protein kinase PknH n=1 Tax=Novipirellula herctigrandis TaxID=2527986 RepID=A0A5C5YND9_9BACT|nr:Serine/threonine-protein kinase PknH [Planctomycetes bacterium CA13]
MSPSTQCPNCGRMLPPDAPGGICPTCLLAAMASDSIDDASEEPRLANQEPDLDATTSYGHSGGNQPSGYSGGNQPSGHLGDLQPGQQFGDYLIVQRLGRGGMGTVYEAEHLEGGRRVALKILRHSFNSPETRERFLREGRLAASINHPNSVYVYGTEEIDGTPAISMELVPGGTLEQRVRHHGPLPIPKAVDAILEVIAGLEAAQAVGVLHRDVKPANCFFTPEGTIKVGDFGLSISTAPRTQTKITSEGTFLGTPAFASPEQLRGDELDIRSDIYSVGVTLYYLLTGRTPFESRHLVQFLATVLESPAPSPRTLRDAIPKELDRIVLRCLEKQPNARYATYDDLRAALLPYSSTAPKAATLGLRVVANFVDGSIWMILFLTCALLWFGDLAEIPIPDPAEDRHFLPWYLINNTLIALYYAIPEGIWGKTLGKKLFRLRVVDAGGDIPGFPKAIVRALIWAMFPQLIYVLYVGCMRLGFVSSERLLLTQLMGMSVYLMIIILFSTARRCNGFAGLHDLATGLRVVATSSYQPRPVTHLPVSVLPNPESMPRIGSYYVLDLLSKNEQTEFFAGYDAQLLRRVWIRKSGASTPPVTKAVRNAGRPGRVRWLGGKRGADENWDAYEFLSGQSLVDLVNQPQPWELVRYWLVDLSEELNAALQDATLPKVLDLDRVWITAENQAKLLDFEAPSVKRQSRDSDSCVCGKTPFETARLFLHQVAIAALEGREVSSTEAEASRISVPIPLHARNVLDNLLTCNDPSLCADAFKQLPQKLPTISRLRRCGLLLGSLSLPIVYFFFALIFFSSSAKWLEQHPDILVLRHCLFRLQLLEATKNLDEKQQVEKRDLGIYVAANFRDMLLDKQMMSSATTRGILIPAQITIAEDTVANFSTVAPEEIDASSNRLGEFVTQDLHPMLNVLPEGTSVFFFLTFMCYGGLLWVIMPSLLFALLFRGGFLIHTLGIAFVTSKGVRASRLRTLWRACIAWLPAFLFPIVVIGLKPVADSTLPGGDTSLVLMILAVIAFVVIWFGLRPPRSLQDRLAGTFMVPR